MTLKMPKKCQSAKTNFTFKSAKVDFYGSENVSWQA